MTRRGMTHAEALRNQAARLRLLHGTGLAVGQRVRVTAPLVGIEGLEGEVIEIVRGEEYPVCVRFDVRNVQGRALSMRWGLCEDECEVVR